MDDTVTPPRIKAAGLYVNSILAKTEATEAGFDEAILLNHDGHVSEGSGENIFVYSEGTLITSGLEDNVLPGVTRNSILKLAEDQLGLDVKEGDLLLEDLFKADEVFCTGTAVSVTPSPFYLQQVAGFSS